MKLNYELAVILASDQSTSNQEKKITELKKLIISLKGKILDEEIWGVRRLAFSINKLEEGYYFILQFELSPENIQKLDKSLHLDRELVRYLIVSLPDNSSKLDYKSIQKDEAEFKIKKEEKKAKEAKDKPGHKNNKVLKPKKPIEVSKVVKEVSTKKTESSISDEDFDKKLEDIIKGDVI